MKVWKYKSVKGDNKLMNSKRLWFKFRNILIFTLLMNIVFIFSIVDIRSIYYVIISAALVLFYLYINIKPLKVGKLSRRLSIMISG